ncbi:MAG: hypothetical protein IT380_29025 [Myxococcales bacterium]|nr:hypothetical protein [Myxococcales bacterium]
MAGAFHVALGRFIVACGSNGANMQSGSYQYSGGTWTALSSSPTAWGWAAMAYDSARQKLVLFGGYTTSGDSADTWEF